MLLLHQSTALLFRSVQLGVALNMHMASEIAWLERYAVPDPGLSSEALTLDAQFNVQ